MTDDMLRAPAEAKYADELDWLESIDDGPKPFSWRLSPGWCGCSCSAPSGRRLDRDIAQKWFGDRSFVERSIVTLASDRGLLPDRRPRHRQELARRAARGGHLPRLDPGRAGHRRHHRGPHQVLVERVHGDRPGTVPRRDDPSPIMTAMDQGVIGRFEELTRATSDVQDALISILSEKYVSIPNSTTTTSSSPSPASRSSRPPTAATGRQRPVLGPQAAVQLRAHPGGDQQAQRGRDRPVPHRRAAAPAPDRAGRAAHLLDILLQSFADLRAAAAAAASDDEKLESALSTAEQIGVLEDAILHSHFFGDRTLRAQTLGGSLVGLAGPAQPRGPGHPQQVLARRRRAAASRTAGPWPAFLEGGRGRSPPSREWPFGALRQQLLDAAAAFADGRAPWPASCRASSTTSTGRCARSWRSSRCATTRPPRRWPWCAACATSSPR